MTNHPFCDQFGRPPPRVRSYTWRERQRLAHEHREESAQIHADWRERAELLTCIEIDEALPRVLDEVQLHEVLGLTPRQLTNGTLSTPLLHAALAYMRGLPRV